ncbi:hypothetical protein D3C72_1282020 [compost metagenome]
MLLNLSILVSSKGASTSSKMQNGAGFNKYSENRMAVAVNVFSPPESWLIVKGRLPLGRAIISISDSNGSLGSTNTKSHESSSLNNERNTFWKLSRICVKASKNCVLAVSSISLMVSINEFLASIKSCFCVKMNR